MVTRRRKAGVQKAGHIAAITVVRIVRNSAMRWCNGWHPRAARRRKRSPLFFLLPLPSSPPPTVLPSYPAVWLFVVTRGVRARRCYNGDPERNGLSHASLQVITQLVIFWKVRTQLERCSMDSFCLNLVSRFVGRNVRRAFPRLTIRATFKSLNKTDDCLPRDKFFTFSLSLSLSLLFSFSSVFCVQFTCRFLFYINRYFHFSLVYISSLFLPIIFYYII